MVFPGNASKLPRWELLSAGRRHGRCMVVRLKPWNSSPQHRVFDRARHCAYPDVSFDAWGWCEAVCSSQRTCRPGCRPWPLRFLGPATARSSARHTSTSGPRRRALCALNRPRRPRNYSWEAPRAGEGLRSRGCQGVASASARARLALPVPADSRGRRCERLGRRTRGAADRLEAVAGRGRARLQQRAAARAPAAVDPAACHSCGRIIAVRLRDRRRHENPDSDGAYALLWPACCTAASRSAVARALLWVWRALPAAPPCSPVARQQQRRLRD